MAFAAGQQIPNKQNVFANKRIPIGMAGIQQ
jgi:hypothetical protein